jgi:hypothetical protein
MKRVISWAGWRDGGAPQRCLTCRHVGVTEAANNINNKAKGIEPIGRATIEAPGTEKPEELNKTVPKRAGMFRTRRRGPGVSPEVARMRAQNLLRDAPRPRRAGLVGGLTQLIGLRLSATLRPGGPSAAHPARPPKSDLPSVTRGRAVFVPRSGGPTVRP